MWNLLLNHWKHYIHYHNAYGSQTWKCGNLPWGTPSHKVPIGDIVFRDHVTNYNHNVSTTTAYGHQTWQDGDLPWAAPTHKTEWPFDHVVLKNQVTDWNHYISTTAVPVVTKLGNMVTYIEGFLGIKVTETFDKMVFRNHVTNWNIKSPLAEGLWPPNFAGWWLTMRSSHPRSHEKLNPSYLH